jgi:hypothetical protein
VVVVIDGAVPDAPTVPWNLRGVEDPTELVAVIVKSYAPVALGVPDREPVLVLRVIHEGSVPLVTANVIGVVPVVARVWEYGFPFVMDVSVVVVIEGAVGVT